MDIRKLVSNWILLSCQHIRKKYEHVYLGPRNEYFVKCTSLYHLNSNYDWAWKTHDQYYIIQFWEESFSAFTFSSVSE